MDRGTRPMRRRKPARGSGWQVAAQGDGLKALESTRNRAAAALADRTESPPEDEVGRSRGGSASGRATSAPEARRRCKDRKHGAEQEGAGGAAHHARIVARNRARSGSVRRARPPEGNRWSASFPKPESRAIRPVRMPESTPEALRADRKPAAASPVIVEITGLAPANPRAPDRARRLRYAEP